MQGTLDMLVMRALADEAMHGYALVHRLRLIAGDRLQIPQGSLDPAHRLENQPAGVKQIRAHLNEIAKAFRSGDFSTPAFVHMQQVPGTSVMAAKRDAISYTYRDLARGGELRIVTKDPEALDAIRAFMAFQRQDHRAGGMDHRKPPN